MRLRLLLPLLPLLPLSLACPPGGDGGPGPGEGEGEEGEGEAGDPFELIATTNLNEADPLAAPGFAIGARSDGRWAVAWFEGPIAEVVDCTQFSGTATEGPAQRLMLADEQLDGTVRIRVVDDFVGNTVADAVDVDVDEDDNVLIAYMGGEPTATFCGATDLQLAVENGDTFTLSTLAVDSDTGTTCRSAAAAAGGDEYCGQGAVVGLSPALAVGQGIVAVAHRDTHFGFADTDITASDLEVVIDGAERSVNMESGAGYFLSAAVTANGDVLIGHRVDANNSFQDAEGQNFSVFDGIYADLARADGTVSENLILDGQRTDSRVATAAREGSGLFVAAHDSIDDQLLLVVSVDDGETWTPEPVERFGRSGRSPGMVFTDDGRLVLAYSHCRDNQNDTSCERNKDGVRLALRTGAGQYKTQNLPGDSENLEGLDVDVAKAGANELVIASFNSSRSLIVVHRVQVK